MKIALAQLNYHIGDFKRNTEKILATIEQSKKNNVDLLVFSELAICGYPPKDLLLRKDFMMQTENAVQKVVNAVTGIAVIMGVPSENLDSNGRKLYNSALFIADGEIKEIYHKSILKDDDFFDETSYFEPNSKCFPVELKGKKIAILIGEDLRKNFVDKNQSENQEFRHSPMGQLSHLNPDLVVHISALPFSVNSHNKRNDILTKTAKYYQVPFISVNHVGSSAELIFEGGSGIVNSQGHSVLELKLFDEDFQTIQFDQFADKKTKSQKMSDLERIHKALILGIKDFFEKSGFQKAVLGLSGGIDSALTAVLAQQALGKENVKALLMPSQFSSTHSVNDAVLLAKNLGISYDTLPINTIYGSFTKTLKPCFENRSFDLAEENIQARIRGTLAMAVANKFGYLLLNTSNKSEIAVGYGTLYGDMNGALSVLGDVYKTDVFRLSKYMNKTEEIIPNHSIIKSPSAELRPDQKDSDSLPEYDVLDEILYHYIEKKQVPEEMIAAGFQKEIIEKVIHMVNTSEYKRFQAPPILRISAQSFGCCRKIPLVAKYPKL